MSTHNIGFYEELTKIIFPLSSNTHLISSSVAHNHTRVDQEVFVAQTMSSGVVENLFGASFTDIFK